MNEELLNFICCPTCRGQLELTAFEGDGKIGHSVGGLSWKDAVTAGLLKCACGIAYPVIDGVPRLLEAGLSVFPEFLESYEAKIKAEAGLDNLPLRAPSRSKANHYDYIRKSFSKEWGLFDYPSDKTWGWTLKERKDVFLHDMELSDAQLRGKVLLDAGCGNGTLTAVLSSLGMEVVGIDLSDRLGVANRNRDLNASESWRNVHFVQGNLFRPPLKPGSFDLIYCSGVIHHTPNSRETFKRLVPLVKKGGRLYVWVYGTRSLPVRLFMGSGRRLKKFMSLESLLITCRVMAPLYKAGTELLDLLHAVKFRKRAIREITLDLFDAFAPQYNHRHTEEEVQSWFADEGFSNISVSGRQKHGFGVYGDKM
jgi:SAM-dependent methyltransferase